MQLDSEKAHAADEARAEAAEIHVQCMHECVHARVLCGERVHFVSSWSYNGQSHYQDMPFMLF